MINDNRTKLYQAIAGNVLYFGCGFFHVKFEIFVGLFRVVDGEDRICNDYPNLTVKVYCDSKY